jgi:predicted  nucleic acid-binding Zn-ribbon protein
MSNTIKKGELFLKEITNRLSGDQSAATAAQITRKAISAFESQIAGLNAEIVDAEDAVETAQDKLKDAIYPTEKFDNNRAYCASIVAAQAKVDAAKEKLDDLNASLAYFTGLLATV